MPVISQSGASLITDMFSNSERNSKHMFDIVRLNPRQIRKEFKINLFLLLFYLFFFLFQFLKIRVLNFKYREWKNKPLYLPQIAKQLERQGNFWDTQVPKLRPGNKEKRQTLRRRLRETFRRKRPVVRILHKGSIREGLAIPTRLFSVLTIAIGVDCFRKQISDHDVQFSLSNVRASYERTDSLEKSGYPWLKVRIPIAKT